MILVHLNQFLLILMLFQHLPREFKAEKVRLIDIDVIASIETRQRRDIGAGILCLEWGRLIEHTRRVRSILSTGILAKSLTRAVSISWCTRGLSPPGSPKPHLRSVIYRRAALNEGMASTIQSDGLSPHRDRSC